MTFDALMKRMLDKVPNDIDKREGSIIYDAIAPVAIELVNAYISLDAVLNESFADTQTREFLIRRAAERGIVPFPATKAILKGVFTPATLEIPIGTRFSCDNLNYSVLEDTLQENDSEDDEDTEVLRKRYFGSFNNNAYGGNIADYIEKTNSLNGVGCTKVTPVWNGGGTVLLTILDSEFNPASEELISDVQEAIDPTQDESGLGIAPIGHVVTVKTATTASVNVAAKFLFSDNYTFENTKAQIEQVISDYLLEQRKLWAESDYLIVRVLQIEARILANVQGVLDITDTKINGSAENLQLSEYQVPVLGVVTNEQTT